MQDRQSELVDATTQHLQITVLSVLLGLGLAFGLALLARRWPRLRTPVLGFGAAVYTIPSLALFPILLPFTGLTMVTVVIGLGLYALTILIRAFLEGFDSVPPAVREAALGMGYSPSKMLFGVELPTALPVIMAGLRVATVSTVALTTVGALISYGGLGNLLVTGVASEFRAQILVAALGCVVIAVLLDVILLGAQRLLMPWSRGRAA